MFERFTSRARRVVVLAQDEARRLQHNYIGSEHLLLGLLGEPESIAGRVLLTFGMSVDRAREEVEAKVGRGRKPMEGHIPFTPRSKKVLELALREALTLGHNYIGTEHLLLALIRQGEGPATDIIAAHSGDDPAKVRAATLDAIPAQQGTSGPRWLRRGEFGALAGPGPGEELRTTPAADASLNAAARLAGTRPVGSHHLLMAALSDPDSAAARAFVTLGVDLDLARDALRTVDVTGTHDEPPEEAGRRQLVVRVAEDRVAVEASDPTLLELARAAVEALGEQADADGTIRGDLPAAVSLGLVWRALRDSLEDIRRRVTAHGGEPGTSGSGGVEPAPRPALDPEQGAGDATG